MQGATTLLGGLEAQSPQDITEALLAPKLLCSACTFKAPITFCQTTLPPNGSTLVSPLDATAKRHSQEKVQAVCNHHFGGGPKPYLTTEILWSNILLGAKSCKTFNIVTMPLCPCSYVPGDNVLPSNDSQQHIMSFT